MSTPDGAGGADRPDAEIVELRAKVARLEAERAAAKPRRHRTKSFFSSVLIVLGCILAPLSVVAIWASNIVGDTDQYVSTVAPLAEDPDVQKAVANRVTDAVMDHVDTDALIQQVAPEDRPALDKALGRLEGPLNDALRSFVQGAAQRFVASDAFATVWEDVNRTAHASINKALTGEGGGAVKLTNDAATLDLAPVIDQVKQRLVDQGLTLANNIPDIHTNFTLVQSDDIGKAKRGFRLLEITGNWLPILALALLAVGVWLATHTRRALVAAALGVAAGVLILGLALTIFRPLYLDALPSGVSQPAAGSVYDILIRFLRRGIRTVAVVGILVALGAWLTGRGKRARAVHAMWDSGIGATRHAATHAGMRLGPVGPWVHRFKSWLNWGAVALAALAVVLWSSPTAWVVILLVVALLAVLAVIEFLDTGGDGEAPADEEQGPGSTEGTPKAA
ncbi:hypothetical protein AB0M28_30390 [Streptomyces sp. NPDC051940]|uniref:hypothetical protein n=1 Tax=Streptomyces sp. NPDC051940 TaxID=3155675 RepID=UPI0034313EF7